MQFGDVLKELRKHKNLTQNDLAIVLGKSRSTIAGYEINDRLPEHETMIKMSNVFDISLENLVLVSKNDEKVLKTLGSYIMDKIEYSAKVTSIEELAELTNITVLRLNDIVDGNTIPTIDELKRIAIFGPFKYLDLISNSIYYQHGEDPFKHLPINTDIDKIRVAFILEINFRPWKFYNEIINFYKTHLDLGYYMLIESYAKEVLCHETILENERILQGFGYDYVEYDNDPMLMPIDRTIYTVEDYEMMLKEQDTYSALMSQIRDLPIEALDELENYLHFMKHKYNK